MGPDALDWQQRKEERLLMDARADAYDELHALTESYPWTEEDDER
jgi:hypothetical protein